MKKFALLAAVVTLAAFASPSLAQPSEWRGVKSQVEISASPEVVWQAVHQQRKSDPDLAYSKVLQQKGNRVLLEQKYNALPVIGEATCLLVQEETPLKRIDYKLVRSDKFKDMSGSWILEAKGDGKTTLELQSLLCTGLPYSQGIINALLQDKITKRLARVKAVAEASAPAKPSEL